MDLKDDLEDSRDIRGMPLLITRIVAFLVFKQFV
jgi:hypothetical protein